MNSLLKIGFFISIIVTLIGCSSAKLIDGYSTSQGSIQAKNIEFISDKISSIGVKVFKYGNSMALYLPNQDFFVSNSANFTDAALDALELIFILSKYQQGDTIAIIGYPPQRRDSLVTRALAKERAHRVMDYLYRSGLSANFVYAESAIKSVDDKKNILSDCVILDLKDFY